GAKYTSGAGANRRLSDVADRAGCLFAARSAFALLRRKHALGNTRSWRPLGKGQFGFVAAKLRVAGEHWEIQRGCNKAGPSTRRDLYRCAVAIRREPDLVRHRRWFDSSHDRCWKNLDQRDARRHFGVAENFVDRSRTFRPKHRLRSGEHNADRRSAAAHFCDSRQRKNVDRDCEWNTGRPNRQRSSRRSGTQRPPVRRSRKRRLHLLRWGRQLEIVAIESAGEVLARSYY